MGKLSKNRGSSLIECVVALGIASMLGLGVVNGFVFLVRWSERIREITRRQTTQIVLHEALSRVFLATDGHRLPIPPRVHPKGRLTFGNGSPIRSLTEHARLSPDPASDALSSLTLRTSDIFRVDGCSRNQGTLSLRASLLGTPSGKFSHIKSLLLLSPAGYFVFPGTIRGSGRTRSIFTHASNSLDNSLDPELCDCSARIAVPVESHELLYVDKSLTWRLARFEGETLIENAPLDFGGVHLSLALSEEHDLLGLAYEIRYERETLEHPLPRNLSGRISAELSRRNLFDLMFNL